MYMFDTGSLIKLFGFYPKRFPTLWKKFNTLIQEQKILSVYEVLKEINDRTGEMTAWSKRNKSIFHKLTPEEAAFVTEIFQAKNGHFQHIVKSVNLLKGVPVADPFVIASAKMKSATVVTEELYKENGAKIPNICEHFDIPYFNLEGFMETEKWEF